MGQQGRLRIECPFTGLIDYTRTRVRCLRKNNTDERLLEIQSFSSPPWSRDSARGTAINGYLRLFARRNPYRIKMLMRICKLLDCPY